MKVLMISGDRRVLVPGTEAHARLQLQRSAVDELAVVYWGRGAMWPALPPGPYDVVTAQDPFWRGLFGLYAAWRLDAKLNIQVHGDWGALWRREPTFKNLGGDVPFREAGMGIKIFKSWLAEFVLKRANSIRVVSEKVKKDLAPLKLQVRIDVLPVFVDLGKVAQAPAAILKAQYPNYTHHVLVVSRLEPEKNVEGALKILAEVVQALPGTGMLIAGSGSQEAELKKKARYFGVFEQVVFLGYRTDLPSLYKGVDLLLVTSPYESWGAAMVEALSAGCPVVAPDVGVAKEAGATVVPREELGRAAILALQSGARGQLQLQLLSKTEWAQRWRETLN